MKHIRKKLVILLTAVLVGSFMGSETVYAFQPDRPYTYDNNEEAVPAINAYKIKQVLDGSDGSFTRLSEPQDLFVDDQDNIYILDSGNCRILILNSKLELTREIKEFTYGSEIVTLAKRASGIFFRESTKMLYIADTENNRILVSDLRGEIVKIYEKPVDELLDSKIPYRPQKIIVDNMGTMYVTSGNVNTGALMVDKDNNFLGFFGVNEVKATLKVKMEYKLRDLMTEEQNKAVVESFQPAEFNNLFWTDERFVYAVSPINETLESAVVKLNVVGKNIFPEDVFFGDLVSKVDYEKLRCSFGDITVDEEGFFTIVDTVSGKLYQYDDMCNLVCVFGGDGWQKGVFKKPIAIESNSNREILVLDSSKGNISVLELTYYGVMVRDAVRLHNEGLYLEAMSHWEEVLRANPNYSLGYIGIGEAYVELGNYKEAMEYFKLGEDQEGYGKAKAELREDWIRENFVFLAIVVIMLILVVMCYEMLQKLFRILVQLCVTWKGKVKR